MSAKIAKSLGGAEDLTFGFGVEKQVRNNKEYPVTQINARHIPYNTAKSVRDMLDLLNENDINLLKSGAYEAIVNAAKALDLANKNANYLEAMGINKEVALDIKYYTASDGQTFFPLQYGYNKAIVVMNGIVLDHIDADCNDDDYTLEANGVQLTLPAVAGDSVHLIGFDYQTSINGLLYPMAGLYPEEELYPSNGGCVATLETLYPNDNLFPSNLLFPEELV